MTDELDSGEDEDSYEENLVLIRFNEEEPMTKDFTFKVGMEFSSLKAFKARQIGREIVEGDSSKQYSLLWSYEVELRRPSQGNTFKLKINRPEPGLQLRAFKAIQIGRQIVEGDSSKQYSLLWSYGAELRRPSLGNIFKLNINRLGPGLQPRKNFSDDHRQCYHKPSSFTYNKDITSLVHGRNPYDLRELKYVPSNAMHTVDVDVDGKRYKAHKYTRRVNQSKDMSKSIKQKTYLPIKLEDAYMMTTDLVNESKDGSQLMIHKRWWKLRF
ncbi:hypothetical protein KIW84_062946 [Lathyrus oleraceus]|uniref:Uncharacterized protein n=1 Tax=Pisum sativum TaxID=3888 RepID=A0A9D5A8Y5_PEA|nr:hypothetical protein KIW84_062946 [Pisum sativum]